MLQAPVFAIGVAAPFGQVFIDQSMRSRHAQQRDVAEVAGEIGVVIGVRQHQELHRELDVDHAAGVVLEVEQARLVRVGGVHLVAHLDDRGAQRAVVARAAQDALADRVEGRADLPLARAVARARERLVLPDPRVFLLVALEGVDRGDHQAGSAARPQREVGLEQHA